MKQKLPQKLIRTENTTENIVFYQCSKCIIQIILGEITTGSVKQVKVKASLKESQNAKFLCLYEKRFYSHLQNWKNELELN